MTKLPTSKKNPNLNRTFTPEYRQKISEGRKRYWASPEGLAQKDRMSPLMSKQNRIPWWKDMLTMFFHPLLFARRLYTRRFARRRRAEGAEW